MNSIDVFVTYNYGDLVIGEGPSGWSHIPVCKYDSDSDLPLYFKLIRLETDPCPGSVLTLNIITQHN